MTFKYKGNHFDGIVNYLKKIEQLDDIINVDVSSVYQDYEKKYIFHNHESVDRLNSRVSEDGDDEYLIFTFNSVKPILTHYSIESQTNDLFYLRSWTFSGSNSKESS